jgi:hypothetical protein
MKNSSHDIEGLLARIRSPDDVPILSDAETVQAGANPYRHVAVVSFEAVSVI